MPDKPTYDELATAFWEYVAASSNFGEGVAPEEAEVERAFAVLDRTGVADPYAIAR